MNETVTAPISPPSAQPAAAPRRRKRGVRRAILEGSAAPLLTLFLLAAWQIAVPLAGLQEFVLPTPWAIVKRMVKDSALLLDHAWVTVIEVVAGFGIAIVTGILTALAIFFSRPFERAMYPILIALQTIPKVALAPLLVLYLGYGWEPKIFLAFLISFFPIVIATVVGLQELDKGLISLARSMGANGTQLFFKIRLPAALPSIFGG